LRTSFVEPVLKNGPCHARRCEFFARGRFFAEFSRECPPTHLD
jgi:hypothetical protein